MTSCRETKMNLKHLMDVTIIYHISGDDVLFSLCRNADQAVAHIGQLDGGGEDQGRISLLSTLTCSE